MLNTTPNTRHIRSAKPLTSNESLHQENLRYQGSGGVSAENRCAGFVPAFLDASSGTTYRSRFADGRPAPIHVLECLPKHLLVRSAVSGCMVSAGHHLISGFLRDGKFFTRGEAADVIREQRTQ